MKTLSFARWFIALFIIGVLTSCNHRDFLYELPSKRVTVEVEFDWSLDPAAAPQGMSVYFYRMESKSSKPIVYDFAGRDGGSLYLMPGTYSAICHNNDSDVHGFMGEDDFEEFGIRLNDHHNSGNINGGAQIMPKATAERIAYSPDSMWVASVPLFIIEDLDPVERTSRGAMTIRFEMLPVVNRYTFHITNPVNFNNSVSVRATISGLTASVHPGRGSTGEETVTHLFDMLPTPDGNLRGEILTFGHCSGKPLDSRADADDTPHILSVYATLSDGQSWTSVHDVTDQIHASLVPDCVVRLDSISFPQTSSGGGLSPEVSDWTGNQEIVGM